MTSAVREKYDRLIADGLTPIPRWGEPDEWRGRSCPWSVAISPSVLASDSTLMVAFTFANSDYSFP